MRTSPKAPLLALLLAAMTVRGAGRLDGFARSFTSENDRRNSVGFKVLDAYADAESDDGLLAKIILVLLAAGGGYAEQVADARAPGDPVLPLVRMGAGYQTIDSGVDAFDTAAEFGHGFLAVDGRYTRFREEAEDDALDLIQLHMMYRMAVGNRLEWDLGIGGSWLRGETSEGAFSFASPVRYWPLEWMGVEIRPVWTSFEEVSLTDVDLSMVFRYKQATARAGYRWLETEGGSEGLSGWRVGAGWRF